MKPYPAIEEWSDALDTADVKLGRPNTTARIVKPSSETVRSGLVNDTPRGSGTVEVIIGTLLVGRGGVVAARQCVQRHLISRLQVDRL